MEKKDLMVLLLSIAVPIILFSAWFFSGALSAFSFESVLWHFVVEVLSAAIGLIVFYVAAKAFLEEDNLKVLLFGIAFMLMGLFDLAHAFAFYGMPSLIVPSGKNISLHYWLAAKLSGALILFLSALLPKSSIAVQDRKRVSGRLVGLAAAFWLLATIVIALYSGSLPVMFIEGAGLTQLKIMLESIAMALFALTALIFFKAFLKSGNKVLYWLVIALIFMVFSELSFLLYKNVWDSIVWIGHLLKVIAYFSLAFGFLEASLQRQGPKK